MNKPIFTSTLLLLLAVPATAGTLYTIDAKQLMSWLDSTDPPLVLDVRGRQAYRAGTLPGAFDAGRDPLGYLPDQSRAPTVLLAPKEIDTELLEAWLSRLADGGHTLWLLSGGMAAWIEAGGEILVPDTSYAKPGRVPFLIPKGLCEGREPAQVFE